MTARCRSLDRRGPLARAVGSGLVAGLTAIALVRLAAEPCGILTLAAEPRDGTAGGRVIRVVNAGSASVDVLSRVPLRAGTGLVALALPLRLDPGAEFRAVRLSDAEMELQGPLVALDVRAADGSFRHEVLAWPR